MNLKYVFVHGLAGWGSYDKAYKMMPYWGMRGGDLMKYLNGRGIDCCAASVSPLGSAWDRACELYAQLTGGVVDYGAYHSKKMRHARYGADFSGRALGGGLKDGDKIVLLGHSFGGATVRLFLSLLSKGDENERAAGGDISPLFLGGRADMVFSVITLAAPHNGTTAYSIDIYSEEENYDNRKKLPLKMILYATTPKGDGRDNADWAPFDMYIDNALALNKSLALPPDIYYFSYFCTASLPNGDGTYAMVKSHTEWLFHESGRRIGRYTGKTRGNYVTDESWRENDGLVNTISARAPFFQPSKEFDRENIEKGVWQVMPAFFGDHTAFQGDITKKRNIRPFYEELIYMIENLAANGNAGA